MVTPKERLLVATTIQDVLKKQMTISGIISMLFREAGSCVVVVGGSAVEFYTAAQYTTVDIDFITGRTDLIKQIMDELGFVNHSGTWILPQDPTVVVEFPAGPLAGSYDKIRQVRMADGDLVEVIGLEDIIIDRTAAATFWRDGSDDYAKYMVLARYDEVDWKYCLEAAAKESCLPQIKRLRDWARRERKKLTDGSPST
jgi:hypothetical protein